MGDLVNLRRFRKSRDRAARAGEAARNRAAFGRTRDERASSAELSGRAEARLDAHRLEPVLRGPTGARPDDGTPG